MPPLQNNWRYPRAKARRLPQGLENRNALQQYGGKSMVTIVLSLRQTDAELETNWLNIPWKTIGKYVERMQRRIYSATENKEYEQVCTLQNQYGPFKTRGPSLFPQAGSLLEGLVTVFSSLGSSCMKRKFHVQFQGGGEIAISPCYPPKCEPSLTYSH